MSFFDTILDLAGKPENTEIVQHNGPAPIAYQGQEPTKNAENKKNGSKNVMVALPPANLPQRKTGSKPEKLSFLKPCPICANRNFIYGTSGGFFCVTCQPGIPGQPVEAAGPDRQAPQSQEPTKKLEDEFSGGYGNSPAAKRIPRKERENFEEAWRWIKEQVPILISNGWSRATLLRRGKHRGARGVAWLSVWGKPTLTLAIGIHGEIIFTFQSGDREIQQSAFPDVSFFQVRKKNQLEANGGVRNPRGSPTSREDPSHEWSGE